MLYAMWDENHTVEDDGLSMSFDDYDDFDKEVCKKWYGSEEAGLIEIEFLGIIEDRIKSAYKEGATYAVIGSDFTYRGIDFEKGVWVYFGHHGFNIKQVVIEDNFEGEVKKWVVNWA